jgi:micrococcal nuclease
MTLKTFSYRRRGFWITLTVAVTIGAAAGRVGLAVDIGDVLEQSEPGLYAVDHFVDGDTIAVDMDGHVESVRLVGIDTPETHKPDTPVQCYGPEASAYTEHLIGHSRVRLVSDALSTDRDRYDRLLRYVYLADGTFVNERLVRQGYAFYYPYFPFSKSAAFKADEQTAMAAHKGLWAECRPEPTDGGGYVSNPQD